MSIIATQPGTKIIKSASRELCGLWPPLRVASLTTGGKEKLGPLQSKTALPVILPFSVEVTYFCDMDTAPQILQAIKKSVHTTDPGATLILFGSYARGDQRPDSDPDILVLIDKDKVTHEDRKRIGHSIYAIELETDIAISPMIFPKNLWGNGYRKYTPFYNNVTQDGIAI